MATRARALDRQTSAHDDNDDHDDDDRMAWTVCICINFARVIRHWANVAPFYERSHRVAGRECAPVAIRAYESLGRTQSARTGGQDVVLVLITKARRAFNDNIWHNFYSMHTHTHRARL